MSSSGKGGVGDGCEGRAGSSWRERGLGVGEREYRVSQRRDKLGPFSGQ